jgi:hypothetical protein
MVEVLQAACKCPSRAAAQHAKSAVQPRQRTNPAGTTPGARRTNRKKQPMFKSTIKLVRYALSTLASTGLGFQFSN